MKKSTKWIIGIVVVVVLIVIGWFSFGHSSESESKDTVKIGIMSGSKPEDEIWKSVAQTAKDKYGLKLKFTHFTDYTEPNKALAQHEIDLNAFQNYPFLKLWNKNNHTDIVPIGDTIISPIRLYSKKYKKVSEIPDGATIAVPNDTNNESRALILLKSAGLITLKKSSGFVGVNDIAQNDKHLNIKAVDAAQTSRSLSDAAGAVVNTNFATSAHLTPKDSIFTEPLNHESKPWINFIAANKDQAHKKEYKEVVKSYQTKKTAQLIKKYYGETEFPAWNRKF